MKQHNYLLDFIKGILIILMVFGHVAYEQSISRYIVYSFHMPLFLFLTGYLLNFEDHIKKIKRFILPYIVASLVYYLYWNYGTYVEGLFIVDSSKGILYYIFYPQYHLWFLYSVIMQYWLIYLVNKYNLWKIAFILGVIFVLAKNDLPQNLLFDVRRALGYFIFTLTGYAYRNKVIDIKILYIAVLFTVISMLKIARINIIGSPQIWYDTGYMALALFGTQNILLGLLVCKAIERYPNIKVNFINYIGENSLVVYLYHVIVYEFLQNWIHDKSSVIIAAIIIPLASDYLLRRFNLYNAFFLGKNKSISS